MALKLETNPKKPLEESVGKSKSKTIGRGPFLFSEENQKHWGPQRVPSLRFFFLQKRQEAIEFPYSAEGAGLFFPEAYEALLRAVPVEERAGARRARWDPVGPGGTRWDPVGPGLAAFPPVLPVPGILHGPACRVF